MLPEGWTISKLANLAKHEKNSFVIGPFGSDLVQSDYRDNGVPITFVRDIKRGSFRWVSNVYLDSDKALKLKAHSVVSGDIVITKMGLPPGIAAEYPADMRNGIITADIIRLRVVKEKTNSSFLTAYLNSAFVIKQVRERTAGQTRPKLTLGDFKTIKVVVPNISEQTKIAKILSTWDQAIATTEQLLANSQQQKKALMQQLLTGKKRLKGFGGEWKDIKLEQVLDGGKRKGKIVETNDSRIGIPYIGSTSFEGGFELYTSVDDAVTCVPEDILVLWDGENAGKVTTGLTGAVSSTVVRYRFKKTQADHRFIAYCLLKDNYKIRAIREGSGIPHMPGDFENWYKLKLPPTLKEQQQISNVLFRADAEIMQQKTKIAYLQQEKKALMQVLLTGKRRVKI